MMLFNKNQSAGNPAPAAVVLQNDVNQKKKKNEL
jgi:hypothetical protein